MKTINIKLEAFEGPFDLLFHLIEKNKIDLYDIPIFSLTDQYIQHLDAIQYIDMDALSEFLVMAATLLEIKSKMLLPSAAPPEEEENDPRDALVAKLLEYKHYKEMSSIFAQKQSYLDTIYFKKPDTKVLNLAKKEEPVDPSVLFAHIDLAYLYQLFQSCMNRRELTTDKIRSGFRSVARDLFTVEDKIKHIKNLLFLHSEIMFNAVFQTSSSKSEKIATFLAMLELIKMNEISIFQHDIFDDILIKSKESAYDGI